MQRNALIGIAAVLALAGGAHAQQVQPAPQAPVPAHACEADLQAILAEMPDLQAMPPDDAMLAGRTLRALSTAARQLAADGHPIACAAAVDALAKVMIDYEMHLVGQPGGAVMGGEDVVVTDAALASRDPRLQQLTAEDLAFATRDVLGNAVFDYGGDRVGEFEGLLVGAAGIATHVLVGHGTFWSIGENRAAVPIELVRWDPRKRLFYIPLGDDHLGDAPTYGGDGWDPLANDRYYASLGN